MADDQKMSERIIIPMSESLVRRIEEWRYANRVPARAEAIRRLIETALAPKPEPLPARVAWVKPPARTPK